MKEVIFFEIISCYCHLSLFVLSTEFDMHQARVKGGWLLGHMMMRSRGGREEFIAMGSGKGQRVD